MFSIRALVCWTMATMACSTLAATSSPAEFSRLYQEALSKGHVRVLISLNENIGLEQIRRDSLGTRSTLNARAAALRTELGQGAFSGGYWNNGLGQIGLYVTAEGLQSLNKSTNAREFSADITHRMRDIAYGADGSLKALEARLGVVASVDVEIFLDIEEAEYDILSDGRTAFRPLPAMVGLVGDRIQQLTATPALTGMLVLDASPAASSSPSFKARIDKNTFFALREHPKVRAIRPLGHVDSRAAWWDSEVMSVANSKGFADVIVALRGSTVFSARTGLLAPKSVDVQSQANERAMGQVLTAAGVPLSSIVSTYNDIGAINARISSEAVYRLFALSDPRILSVQLNRPTASTALTNSTSLLRLGPTWTAGYIGAGQYITVYDTGIRKSHVMMQMAGDTKVWYEGCYGTNESPFVSICPSPNGAGDSPANTTNSGEPFTNATFCAAKPGTCAHGTHVGGIAAGISSATTSPTASLPGVASGAKLISVQVFSFDTTNNASKVFDADLLQALTDGYASTVSGTSNPYTINMSFGGWLPQSDDCDFHHTAIAAKIVQLTSRGVPVVVATGNNSETNRILWPACNAERIKVSSVSNDATGTALSTFANIAQPANFTGPIFLAPGGQGGGTPNYIHSARNTSNTASLGINGTSQAAPHVSGIYALIKAASPGVTVADATAWIVGSASFNVTYNLPSPAGTQSFRRIQLPASY